MLLQVHRTWYLSFYRAHFMPPSYCPVYHDIFPHHHTSDVFSVDIFVTRTASGANDAVEFRICPRLNRSKLSNSVHVSRESFVARRRLSAARLRSQALYVKVGTRSLYLKSCTKLRIPGEFELKHLSHLHCTHSQ